MSNYQMDTNQNETTNGSSTMVSDLSSQFSEMNINNNVNSNWLTANFMKLVNQENQQDMANQVSAFLSSNNN